MKDFLLNQMTNVLAEYLILLSENNKTLVIMYLKVYAIKTFKHLMFSHGNLIQVSKFVHKKDKNNNNLKVIKPYYIQNAIPATV